MRELGPAAVSVGNIAVAQLNGNIRCAEARHWELSRVNCLAQEARRTLLAPLEEQPDYRAYSGGPKAHVDQQKRPEL